MKRARVWLGTNRQDWYWRCVTCSDAEAEGMYTLHRSGGIASDSGQANDEARLHLMFIHKWTHRGINQ